MSYRGYPRGIEKDDPKLKDFIEEIEVSAIANALSLKFKEGKEYHCYATHFPSNEDAKDLAQVTAVKTFLTHALFLKWPLHPLPFLPGEILLFS